MPYTPAPPPDDVFAQIGLSYSAGSQAAASTFDLGVGFGVADPAALAYQQSRGLELASLVPEQIADHVNDVLRMIEEEGLGMDEAGRLLEGGFAFDGAYADLLARTETAMAMNQGAVATFRESGFTHVQVLDGDGCDACHDINGEIWTLDEAEENDIEHPNCLRSFTPIAISNEERDQEAA